MKSNIFNLNLSSYFASRVKAIVAETRGVEALVPVNPSVQPALRSIVVCYITKNTYNTYYYNYFKDWCESDYLFRKPIAILK